LQINTRKQTASLRKLYNQMLVVCLKWNDNVKLTSVFVVM